MRTKAQGTGITDELLKTLWNNQLPEQLRTILASGHEVPIDTCANMADRIWEEINHKKFNINAIAPSSSNQVSLQSMQTQINELFELVKNNQQSRSRSWSRSNNQKRGNTPAGQSNVGNSSNQQRFETCWWHFKFGAEARKCKQPCNFHTKNTTNPRQGN